MPPRPRARIYLGTPANLALLSRVLTAGRLVAVPTETVYGLAANALDARACQRIFSAKGRPATDPLIVHLHSANQLAEVAVPNAAALLLAAKFWPGPLTLVLPKKNTVPSVVTAGLPSVAVRVPSHPLFRRLLKHCGMPLAAPSANRFGAVSPTCAQHVRDSLGDRIQHILDGGDSTIGIESTIVDLRNPAKPRLLRPGMISQADIEHALGARVTSLRRAKNNPTTAQLAPGLLTRHYSPRTPVVLHRRISVALARRSVDSDAWLFFAKPDQGTAQRRNVFWLDEHGHLAGAARSLFRRLRELDTRQFSRIHAELARGRPEGLVLAINDRLRRAATREQ